MFEELGGGGGGGGEGVRGRYNLGIARAVPRPSHPSVCT